MFFGEDEAGMSGNVGKSLSGILTLVKGQGMVFSVFPQERLKVL